MSSFDSDAARSDPRHPAGDVPVCPACQSAAVTTKEKRPDANSYWRCHRCGEVWNVGRRHDRPGSRVWR